MTGDVFEKDPFRAELKDDAGNIGPEVAGIIGAAAFPGRAEGLARISGQDGIEGAAEGPGIEAAQAAHFAAGPRLRLDAQVGFAQVIA